MAVQDQLIKYNESDIPINFVSMAVYLNEDKLPFHAAILVRHLSNDYLFHYPGGEPPKIEVLQNVELENILVYKILENFDTEEDGDVGSFLQYCKRVCAESDITYGFIVDNSRYLQDGRYQSLSELPEIASCVGFCLNVLANTILDINDSYFKLDEWDDSGVNQRYDLWAQQEARRKYPSLDWNKYNAFKKRISPLEYLAASFCQEYPITKDHLVPIISEIDSKLQTII